MSVYFSKVMNAGGRNREFNFRQVTDGQQQKYGVDVPDDRGNRMQFFLLKEDGKWVIQAQNVPDWVNNAAAELGNAIDNNEDDMLGQKKSKITWLPF